MRQPISLDEASKTVFRKARGRKIVKLENAIVSNDLCFCLFL